jgi:transketolase
MVCDGTERAYNIAGNTDEDSAPRERADQRLDSGLLSDLTLKSKTIRELVLKMISTAKSGHPGGSLSAAEIVTALYFNLMNVNPADPKWPDRDRFVLSKGHAAPVLYAALALRGYFETDELWGLRKLGSFLQGHPDSKLTPGVDASTGSLGQGLSIAVGMALGARVQGKNFRSYVLLGDGEVQEGQVWEASMAAAHYNLSNITAFIDHNGLQIDGAVTEVMSPEPLAGKWEAFGWNVSVINGHDFEEIISAARSSWNCIDKPTMIIANTVKGKGVSFMENRVEWHGKAPSPDQVIEAIKLL